MATTNSYCTLTDLKARLTITNTTDDATLKLVMESVSRWIDQYCRRFFFVEMRTRYFTAQDPYEVEVSDLLSVNASGLTTDGDGDRTYEDTWATTDFDLLPLNALYESPLRPYTSIAVAPLGSYSFPTGVKGVSVAGKWGFSEVLSALDTLGAAITSTTTTTITVTTGASFSAGQTILIGSEQMHVQSISGTTVTVTRGVNGTTAATASNGAAISLYSYPMVNEACLLQCSRLFARRHAPFGISGNAELGTMLAIPKLDSDVAAMLNPLKSWGGVIG